MTTLATFTKELATPYVPSRRQTVVRISSNLLRHHGFTPGTRITKTANPDGPGFQIKPSDQGEQMVYSRGYTKRDPEFREAVIEIADSTWTNRLLGADRAQILSRPGCLQIRPIPNHRFQIISKAKATPGLPMFSVLSSGICAHAFTQAGFQPQALCEWRPPEKRDIAAGRDLTETGVQTALENIPFPVVFNQDIFTLSPQLINEGLENRSITLLAGSLQCDSFSNLKSAKLKTENRLTGEPGDAELFYPLLKTIEHTAPAIIFIENVPAFLNSEIGGAFKAILRRLGYYISQETLNGADFETHASRPRGFLVASAWPGFSFPKPTGRNTQSLQAFLGRDILQDCQDVTESNLVKRALAKKRLRTANLLQPTAPVFPKSQARVDDRVLFQIDDRLFNPNLPSMRKIHGIPEEFKMGHLPQDIQCEQIGQGVDYELIAKIAKQIHAHVTSHINSLF